MRACVCVTVAVERRTATHLDPRTCHRSHAAAAASGTSRADRRRRDWVDRKQKSKSFDFCWQSGLWSPIDRPCVDVVVGGPSSRQPLPPAPPPPPAPTAVPPATAVKTIALPATAPLPQASTEHDADDDSCRRTSPRLKLPPMFHMDSGSSFESYEPGDGLLQHQLLKVFSLCLADCNWLRMDLIMTINDSINE